MLQTMELRPGVQLSCIRDPRFKQGCLSLHIPRMMGQEAGLNALLTTVLLRGTREHPDLRAITQCLDTLYGAAISPQVRRMGDYQTTGFYCAFMDDRFALPGDQVLAPMTDFLGEVLLRPRLREGCFLPEIVESEKKNLISTIDSSLNDKRAYALQRLLKITCPEDSFSQPRLGTREQVGAITPELLMEHYRKILRESQIRLFYVGSQDAERVAELLGPVVAGMDRDVRPLPQSRPFAPGEKKDLTETMEITQGKFCMSFTTEITNMDPGFPAMQLFNVILGGGMTSKLFMVIREKLSLCYSISTSYHGSRGLLLLSAGIDFQRDGEVREEVLRQLRLCQEGHITEQELTAAKNAMLSSLRAVHDSPGAMENFYTSQLIAGTRLTHAQYMEAVAAATTEDVVAAANGVRLHSTYFLRGERE